MIPRGKGFEPGTGRHRQQLGSLRIEELMGRYSGRGGYDHIAIYRRSGLTPKGDLAIVIPNSDMRLGLMGMKKFVPANVF